MAQIDTSMYNNLQAPKIASPFENAAMMAQIQQGQSQNRLAQMKFAEAERETERGNALSGITRQYGNTPEYGNRLMDGGFAQEAQAQEDYAQKRATGASALKTSEFAQEKARIAAAMDQFGQIEQIMAGAIDQPSYTAAAQQVAAILGPDVAAKIPPNYDPAAMEQGKAQAMDLKSRLEQRWKELDAGSKERDFLQKTDEFAYRQQNDAANRAQQKESSIRTDSRARDFNASKVEENAINRSAKQGKPLPVGALKLRVESQEMADIAEDINERLTGVESRITTGKLSFGPVSNLSNKALNLAGMSTEKSRNFASFKAEIEKLRNDSLRLNKGVQTDGDATRAWNEIMENITDTKLVQQRLSEIKVLNERAKNLRLMEVDTINRNYGANPADTGQSANPVKPAANGKTVTRTGTVNGKKVVEYSDGSVEFAK